MQKILMPQNVRFILNTLSSNDCEAFAVGGCIRDSIMGREPKDWDIATSALPEQVKNLFRYTVDTGVRHGTVTVVIDKKNYEVTTYRIDGKYSDSRRPDNVTYTSDLTEDLLRRDFTMNAIAYNEFLGLVDPFNGIADIKNRIIRGVGNADLRFKEDALRMLRAIRFSAQLGFDIEEDTFKAVLANASLIANISVERIRDEFVKLIMSDNPCHLQLFYDTGLVIFISRQLDDCLKANMDRIIANIKQAPADLPSRLSVIFLNEGNLTFENLKHLRFDNNTIKETIMLVEWVNKHIGDDFYSIRKTLSVIGKENLSKVIALKKIIEGGSYGSVKYLDSLVDKIENIILSKDCILIKGLKINGNDLKDLGITNGKRIGEILNSLFDSVLKNPELNDREYLLDYAGQLKNEVVN